MVSEFEIIFFRSLLRWVLWVSIEYTKRSTKKIALIHKDSGGFSVWFGFALVSLLFHMCFALIRIVLH